MLPEVLAGVRGYVGHYAASPILHLDAAAQFHCSGPAAGDVDFFIALEGTSGSTHADGSIINAVDPTDAGETVVLYGTGLGRTEPAAIPGQINLVPGADPTCGLWSYAELNWAQVNVRLPRLPQTRKWD